MCDLCGGADANQADQYVLIEHVGGHIYRAVEERICAVCSKCIRNVQSRRRFIRWYSGAIGVAVAAGMVGLWTYTSRGESSRGDSSIGPWLWGVVALCAGVFGVSRLLNRKYASLEQSTEAALEDSARNYWAKAGLLTPSDLKKGRRSVIPHTVWASMMPSMEPDTRETRKRPR